MRAPLAAMLTVWPVLAAGGEFFTLDGHGGPIMDVTTAPDGTIATASFDNAVGLWPNRAPRWLDGHQAAVNTVIFLPDGRLASGGDDFDILLWERDGSAERLTGHEGKVMALAVSPDGDLLASAAWDGRIGLWPLAGGAPRFLEGHDAGVNDVAFLDGGATLFSASSDGTLRAWSVANGSEERVLVENGFGINAFHVKEEAGWLAYGTVDGGTRVVDIESGDEIADFSLDRRPILSLTADDLGRYIAVGDGEGYIMVIDTTDWSIARDFRATDTGPVWALAFSPDGTNIHAGGLDDTLYSWPLASLDEAAAMQDGAKSFLRDPDEMENGERQFARKCSICHSLTPGSERKAGPTLYGLFGRPAGSVADYSYSETLRNSDIVWNDDTIDGLFDLGPDHFIPGSKMPMQRIAQPQDREDLVAFLRRATDPETQQ
ncbi:c-type cytochrome [Tranquillimonas alkanivorans]|uniref:WD-40 repeat-containing protein n=1 Tax=Tranquillimonas alkanivorans TaxID=441119 RepID=A0A1I5KIU5_9RHOB|nr:c-type cytochrome [Tranquillimonas alkanivorans]SFO84935.1 WD-40 repeat-containing protein [Tranquillimonas alkanivorans]